MAAFDGQAGVGDGAVKVLAHLYLSMTLPDRDADLVGAGQSAGGDAGNDRGQQVFGGGQQFVAFAGAFGGQSGLRQAISRSPG